MGFKWSKGLDIWGAFADYGMIVARSDPSALKHKGPYFYLDMKTWNKVRPIKQISGTSNLTKSFLMM